MDCITDTKLCRIKTVKLTIINNCYILKNKLFQFVIIMNNTSFLLLLILLLCFYYLLFVLQFYGVSPLHAAAYNGHNDVVLTLIEKGANINILDNVSINYIIMIDEM